MKRSRFIALLLILTATGLLAGGLIARASSVSGNSQTELQQIAQQRALKKVAPWVLAKTADGQEAEFLVMLGDQADLSAAYSLETKEQKGRYVFNALRAKAENSQSSLLAWLEDRKVEHQSFYIVNAVLVKGSRELAMEIAARQDVASIAGNPEIRGVRPVDVSEEDILKAARSAAEAPQDIEPGVSYIHAPEVWAAGFTGQGIVIGGQDTGVEWSHPALKTHYRGWDGTNANHDYNWHDSIHVDNRNCTKDTVAPCDDDSHGTHTLGSALGSDGAANQVGVAPGAKFIACRNMNLGDGKPSTYLECIEWLLAPYPNGATAAQGDPTKAPDITTNSWTCPPSEGCEPNTLKAALEAHRAAGILTVAAAGNSGSGCSTVKDPPGIYDAVYTVGAISGSTGTIASFSSRGPVTIDGSNRLKPDITAPGVLVRSAIRGGGYSLLSGTSMATPHVAGAVALLWSARPELRGKVDLTENILNESAVRVTVTDCGSTSTFIPNSVYGFGRLDIKAAVDLAATSLDASEFLFGVKGGAADITVMALPNVTWRAVSDSSWITVTAGQTGTGLSAVFFNVAANTSPNARTGSLLIAGRTVKISQPGVAPLFSVSGKVASSTGVPMLGVTLSFSRVAGGGDIPGSVITDSEGNWNQSGFEPGTTYKVTASRIRSSFSPLSLEFTASTSTLDFVSVGRSISR
ncbi:MAG TPA: S8 family serine peptidase [Blastocatellia bacterium]|nr:S8 family serine peptidase [Blastocatellia bacterium]